MQWRGRAIFWSVVALIAIRIAIVGVTLATPASPTRPVLPGDVRRYHHIAAGRGTPYADFAVEYPPITLAAIDALDASSIHATAVRVMWTQLVLDLGVAAIVGWGWGRRVALLYLLLGLAFVWYPFLYVRLDLISVALAVGGVALVRRRKVVTGAGLVALACFAKIWPIALAPAFAVRRSWAAVTTFLSVGALGVAAWVGWAGFAGPVQVLTFRGAKGWQIESTVGAVIHAASSAQVHMESGAVRVGTVPDWARLGLPILGLLVVAAVWILATRIGSCEPRVLDGLAPVAAIAALLVCATILSPQYVSWLLPFAAIAAANGETVIGWLTGATALLSTLGVAVMHGMGGGGPLALTVVIVRNGVLVALLATAVVRLFQLARSESSVPLADHRAPIGLRAAAWARAANGRDDDHEASPLLT